MAILAIVLLTLYMRPYMRCPAIYLVCMLFFAGCAHMEVPTGNVYPFRAEFNARGSMLGKSLSSKGAIYLSSCDAGVVQTYLNAVMPTHSIDIKADSLIIRDMWGKELDSLELPLSGLAGLVAGDMPAQRYLYKQAIKDGTRIVYTWGVLHVDSATLPREVHIPGSVPLDLFFKPAGKNVTMEVNYGKDAITVQFNIIEGGRWNAS